MKAPKDWPTFNDEAARFYGVHMARPIALFDEFTAKGSGSGRRAGPRDLLWQTVAVFAFGALEAGFEDLLYAAHAARQGSEGQSVEAGKNSVDSNPRAWLIDKRIQNPGPEQISRILFSDFGIVLGQLPPEARFEVRYKLSSKRGSGRGERKAGPTDWKTLANFLLTLSYIRNATAHGDPAKLHQSQPQHCEGSLWLTRDNGRWSIQQPHALTALRTVLSVYNTVAIELATKLGVPPPSITPPNAANYRASK
jgi:hypothetical protein